MYCHLLNLCLVGALGCTLGCTSTKQSNTARTATEQMLIANAVDHSLAKIDFSAFEGSNIYLEEKYMDCVDKGYVIASLRHKALLSNVKLVSKPEEAEIIVELRAGAVGTDMANSFVGVPEIVLPGMLTLPEVRLVTREAQSASAKIGLVAYDAKTKQILGEGGVSLSKSEDSNWYVMGIGPYQNGNVRNEVEFAGKHSRSYSQPILPSGIAFAPRTPAPEDYQLTSEESEPNE